MPSSQRQPCPTDAALPRPAYEADTPLERLDTAELLLVTTQRLWLANFVEPGAGHPSWSGGCRAAGLAAATAQAFDAFWRLVAAAPRRGLDLRCPRCPRLGADEGRFLQAVQALQSGQDPAARAILADWLPPAGLRLALLPLLEVAMALLDAGLALPDRLRLPALPPGSITTACPDRGLALVH